MKHRLSALLYILVPVLSLAIALGSGFAADLTTRIVNITPDTEVFEVNAYYSPFSHGPTQKFFLLPGEGIVVVVATKDGSAKASAEIKVFSRNVTIERLRLWVNNQHSDALLPDAPKELRTIAVPRQYFHSSASGPLDHEVGRSGEQYDRVQVNFSLNRFTDGEVTVEPFRDILYAFVRTKVAKRPRF
jgi:hypothetical protein